MKTPKSANSMGDNDGYKVVTKKRAKSWEAERRWSERSREEKKPFDVREWCCYSEGRCEWCSLVDLCSRSSSGCGHDVCEDEGRIPRTFPRWSCPCPKKRRSRSWDKDVNCRRDAAKGILCSEADMWKMRRSLRLLGLELSDFGIYSGGGERSLGWKAREQCPTFRTKVSGRSVSLEWLRESVRKAWAEDDESHRSLLARAAYEEWYFRKEKELRRKQEEEKLKRVKAGGRLREEIEKKKEKSKEEFDKWLQRKKMKRKEKQESGRKKEEPLRVLMKSKEEIEQAFLKWKKAKDEELEKRKKERKKEEEKKKGLERQKAEKKATAEKAFLQWKSKLEENEKKEEEKRKKRKKIQEEIERRRKGKERATSFEAWKEAKELEIRSKMRRMREAEKAAQEERLAQIEERMYEAEQAFEDWLEKIDSRKQKQFNSSYQNPIPWIPA